jgi:Pyridoxamine 5'-phosphate oxidase
MRSTEQRKSDAIGKLETDQDVWVATADERGNAHLVPLSLCWHDGKVVVAVEGRSRTARNASASGQARLALGPSRDVVMIDATAALVPCSATAAIAGAYRDRTGWSPGANGGEWVFILLQPTTMQVWREVDEIAGRTVMRDGAWLG